ncbi:hypothetical protein VMZ82_001471 [Providencia rettgeri]|nr:glycosyltransferase [Providencia rettgeri]EMC8778641.1 hypothetical protein [Providencia rettgeri]MCG9941584.1 hypothetical protein [Providencia rettgeri]
MNFFESVIKEQASFLYEDDNKNIQDEKFNIAYGADKNFLFGTGVSIASVLLNNKDMSFHFHIFTDFLSHEDSELFNEISKLYNTCVTLYTLNMDTLKHYQRIMYGHMLFISDLSLPTIFIRNVTKFCIWILMWFVTEVFNLLNH